VLITSVKPNITRDQAVTKFRWRLRRLKHGRLRFAVDFYVPYRFFQTTWDDGRSKSVAFLAADAVTGKLDLIEFNQLPADGEIVNVDTQMIAEERINDEEARSLVRERILGLTFNKKGFFKLSRVNVVAELAARLHLPYWVGVYERDGRAQIEIVNALRGRLEGVKLREIVTEWFQSR
jgi:hypothetical protein